ncbi:hypothetical protein GCK32_018786 [Trichostrongylus colubriformis]|uniref:Uncharacterized protein n=1 Tax=Trichostrongylus colubriformis TaxID=6319 RepID=A0AAN8IWH0_TRICO
MEAPIPICQSTPCPKFNADFRRKLSSPKQKRRRVCDASPVIDEAKAESCAIPPIASGVATSSAKNTPKSERRNSIEILTTINSEGKNECTIHTNPALTEVHRLLESLGLSQYKASFSGYAISVNASPHRGSFQ